MTDYTDTKIELKKLCDLGLAKGIGNRDVPGNLCIESAIALALGESHSDKPSCVHEVDRAFAVTLNDATWSDPMVRGKALYALGCAQLGTSGADRTEWVKRLVEGIIRRVLPIALRAAAEVHPETAHRDALRAAADRCEAEGTGAYACAAAANVAAANAAVYATDAANVAAANAAVYATDAANAANAAVYPAARAYAAADAVYAAYAAAYAAADAVYAAYAAAHAAAAAAANAAYATDANAAYATDADACTTAAANAAAAADRDNTLTIAVDVALDAYRAEGRVQCQ